MKRHYYGVVESCGISHRGLHITSLGLRHTRSNDRYEEITGVSSPVRGGLKMGREAGRAAWIEIAEELRYSRQAVTTHYLGR